MITQKTLDDRVNPEHIHPDDTARGCRRSDQLCRVVDPESENSFPAVTTLLHLVCDNDSTKFLEATRLIDLISDRVEADAIAAASQPFMAALTASELTEAAYIQKFTVPFPVQGPDGEDVQINVNVPWVTIKQVMSAILELAKAQAEIVSTGLLTSTTNSSHDLYRPGDFTNEEWDTPCSVARMVIDGGIGICKVCGAAESELQDFPTCVEYRASRLAVAGESA